MVAPTYSLCVGARSVVVGGGFGFHFFFEKYDNAGAPHPAKRTPENRKHPSNLPSFPPPVHPVASFTRYEYHEYECTHKYLCRKKKKERRSQYFLRFSSFACILTTHKHPHTQPFLSKPRQRDDGGSRTGGNVDDAMLLARRGAPRPLTRRDANAPPPTQNKNI